MTDDPIGVLLVDDHEANLVTLSAVLTSPNYDLVMASSGADALKLLEQREFAVVLLDVMMPNMDGFECAKRIRSAKQGRKTPIIFITAVATDMTFVFKGYDTGAVDYVTKPFEPAVIRSKVAVFADLFVARRTLKTQLAETRALCASMEAEVTAGQHSQDLLDQVRFLVARLETEITPSGFPKRLPKL